jgi:hypothetical protein
MTEQPLVSCWSASVAYLPVSFRAFWMSVWKPISLNDFSRAGRSPFSQRLDESASGSITQARFAAAAEADPEPVLPLVESSLLQPASVMMPAAATKATVAVLLNVIGQNSSGRVAAGPEPVTCLSMPAAYKWAMSHCQGFETILLSTST